MRVCESGGEFSGRSVLRANYSKCTLIVTNVSCMIPNVIIRYCFIMYYNTEVQISAFFALSSIKLLFTLINLFNT